MSDLDDLLNKGEFAGRHLGSDETTQRQMLDALKVQSLDALVREVVPAGILLKEPLALGEAMREPEALAELSVHAMRNEVWRSFIGMGYHGTHTPAVIQRNVLENPGWYTAYTPYQAEISQGRLEGLLNFQQMVIDLTGLPVANASLLDEATAAAEAMAMIRRSARSKSAAFFVDSAVHPQVLSVMRTRAKWLGIELIVGEDVQPEKVFGAHLQYPDTFGRIRDFSELIGNIHAAQGLVSMGTDLLALLLLRSPGAMGADVAIGSAQRFGVPMGFGGPHAAFMACRDEYKRSMPGRIIGVSVDAAGRPALRMALQTREQHIRRDKATSNICTAQALLANMAGFYAVYHGPRGLTRIARRANYMARLLAVQVPCESERFFDTVVVKVPSAEAVRSRADPKRINLRYLDDSRVAVSFDELTSLEDVADVAEALSGKKVHLSEPVDNLPASIPTALRRTDAVLSHPVFNRYHTETEMMRYLKRLENRDLSLVHSMIPLGSCTMKLNAAAELLPISWPRFAALHPFAPAEQVRGTLEMIRELEGMLAEVTGFAGVSLQPNSGAQGEYAGLLAIRDYLAAKGEGERDVCLIPASAHGTNPASAQMMGLRIVVVGCDPNGNVDLADLERKVAEHRARLAALMITYPSTHGVFEEAIVQICEAVHAAGGQVYMDGANLNALAGLAKPAQIGADVCHINLHKTFCIPHGGGGPGMGPIAVAAHLTPFLPRHPLEGDAVSAAPYGSALILPISWMYLRMMGAAGVRRATELAILNANYIAARLAPYFPVLYKGARGRVAHECILDLRKLKPSCGVSAEDVAKRLMDYGFHSPTLSFPVADTLMVEPTESESKEELDRFCDAMIAIHAEVERIRAGTWDRADNPLKNAPHTALELAGDWKHPYSREQAAYPRPWLRAAKYWPPVKRIDNAAGDRNLICTCPPIEAYA
ncbi:MAG TPA: aminomethyl-transferring glycine dehydrogenase [Burkholderiales bacterium]|nr:aminomethyl-transferring glycine dehydrogenase [Burkholderiales bacterium]